MLGFETESGALGIGGAAFASDFAIEKISGVKLDAGFGGPDFHDTAGGGLDDARGKKFLVAGGHAQDKVVVVTTAEFYLLIVGIDARADGGGFAKVEGRAGDVAQLSSRNQAGIHGSELVGGNHQLVGENVAVTLAGEIEVGVIGEIDDGFFVGGGGIIDVQSVGVRPRVGDGDFQVAGKTFLAVFAEVGKFERLATLCGNGFGGPQHFIETLDAAMESVLAIVFWERVGFAVQARIAHGRCGFRSGR